MLRIAIVEDVDACATLLEEYLERYQAENGVSCSVTRFADGMELAANYQPEWDLIFLDVEMPLLDGIATARQIRAQDTAVALMFITNMAQYAIKGYEVDALDYVLKPVSYYAFSLKMQKAMRALSGREERSLLLTVGGEVTRLPLSALRYVEVFNHQLRYFTTQGEYTTTGSRTLKDLAAELSDDSFALCNSCYLVNLRHVDGIKEEHVMVRGVPLKISRNKRREFMQALLCHHRGTRL